MSSRLLAVTLLAVGLAGPAFAAQVKAPDALADTAHGSVADVMSFMPVTRSDTGMWSTAEAWTIPSQPAQRIKAVLTGSVADAAVHAVVAPVSKSPSLSVLTDANGALPRLVLGSEGTEELDDVLLGSGSVSEHRPDGKLVQVR